ncbi:MAG: low-specificity L-threonine aldolase [Gammaproteobacteria bacterium]|nr:low-specificity L-threonine aldolase [Gammaproteobacteria bacterium]
MNTIDLRSDTVTRPSKGMRKAMAEAELGDDVYGDDPTVNRLQALAAETLGFEAALFVPSGTQSNLVALLSHCERGDEYIVGQLAHTYKFEAGGGAVLGSIQPQPLDFAPDGTLDLTKVAGAIKADDVHFARTRLLCLENTYAGRALPMSYLAEARAFVDVHGLALHLDGARIFNAAVKHGVAVTQVSQHFDTISFCLSKGLGCPVGSLLCGSHELLSRGYRWRKMLGGGMRQAGVIAAAGIYALENNVQRLQEDHDNAERLACGLGEIDELQVNYDAQQTNMVFVDVAEAAVSPLQSWLRERGIIVTARDHMRLVTHLDVAEADIDRVVDACKGFFAGQRQVRGETASAAGP